MNNRIQIKAIAEEAARILRDYPELKYYEAIQKAKEVLKDANNIQRQYKQGNP